MAKIYNDKYYTDTELASYIVNKTNNIIGEHNIYSWIEPSAGNGAFIEPLKQTMKPFKMYDIEPEHSEIIKSDYLNENFDYTKGVCVIGNPPYGRCLSLAQKFFKHSIEFADYIAFILPISQLNNTNSFYEFDLIYSEDLGEKYYSGTKLHCCFNIYKRPKYGYNSKPVNKLKDVTIIRQDSKIYDSIVDYDIRFCYWGDSCAGKVILDNKKYSGEYKIIINNNEFKESIIELFNNYDWKKEIDKISMRRIKQWQIINVLKSNIIGIT